MYIKNVLIVCLFFNVTGVKIKKSSALLPMILLHVYVHENENYLTKHHCNFFTHSIFTQKLYTSFRIGVAVGAEVHLPS